LEFILSSEEYKKIEEGLESMRFELEQENEAKY
jgi:hypothetical protein